MPTPPKTSTITLTHQSLEKLFNAYQIQKPLGIVLFGLRGVSPTVSLSGWVRESSVLLTPIDYDHLKCTLGIWNPKSEMLFTALASTVPHHEQVEIAAARLGRLKGRGTNQLEPGYYSDLTKGEHLQGKPKGHSALRQTAFRFYRRSHLSIPYRLSDPLYFGNPYDNLHCSWNRDGENPGFSSAGCLVVAGLPHCPRLTDTGPNQGDWKVFHDIIYAAKQKTFPLLLISGLEASRVLSEKNVAPRLVYGSQGKVVSDLQQALIKQKKLSGKPTGYLGSATYKAWNNIGLKGYGDILGVSK